MSQNRFDSAGFPAVRRLESDFGIGTSQDYEKKGTTTRSDERFGAGLRYAGGGGIFGKSILGRPFCLLRHLLANLCQSRAIGLRGALPSVCEAGGVSRGLGGNELAILSGFLMLLA